MRSATRAGAARSGPRSSTAGAARLASSRGGRWRDRPDAAVRAPGDAREPGEPHIWAGVDRGRSRGSIGRRRARHGRRPRHRRLHDGDQGRPDRCGAARCWHRCSPSTATRSRTRAGASRTRALVGRRDRARSVRSWRAPGRRRLAVVAVGLTGQMHGLVLLDAADDVLRPAILWNDQRTAAECDLIRAAVGHGAADRDHRQRRADRVHGAEARLGPRPRARGLGTDGARPAAQGLPAPAPDRRARDGQGGRVRARICSTCPRATGRPRCSALGIDRGWMPPTFEGPVVTGTVIAAAAAGNRPAGGHPGRGWRRRPDRPTRSAWAPVGPGLSLCPWARRASSSPLPTRHSTSRAARVHAFCHAAPGRWHLMSVMLSAAGSLRWFRDALAPGEAFGDLVEEPLGRRRAAMASFPAIPHRRAQPAPGSDCARRVRRPALTHGRRT